MIYRYGITALVVLMPWHEIIVRLWPPLRIWDEVLLLLLAGALVVDSARRRALPAPRLLIPMAALLGIALLSGFVNQLPLTQVAAGIRALFPYMLVGLVAARLAGEAAVCRMLRLMVLMGTLAAVYGIAGYLCFRSLNGRIGMPPDPRNFAEAVLLYPYQCGGYPEGWRLAGSLLNDNYLGDWLGMLVPVAFFLGRQEQDRARRIGYLLATLLMTVALAWTFSRAAYAGFAVSLALFAWRIDRRILLACSPFLLAMVLVATPVDVYRFTNVHKTQGGRVAAVQKAAAVQVRSPLVGRGPGTSGVMDVHYARIAAQMGLLGFAVFGWLLAASCRPALRERKGRPETWELRLTLLASLAVPAVAALGGDVWEIPQLAYAFWMTAGFLQVLQPTQAGGPDRLAAPLRISADQAVRT